MREIELSREERDKMVTYRKQQMEALHRNIERVATAMREADPLGRGYRGDWNAYVPMARAAINAYLAGRHK